MREFLKHDSLHVEDIDILKNGRHLRLPDGAKLVIGRDQSENILLEKAMNNKYIKIKADEIPGPFSLLLADASDEDKKLSARIVLTFTKTQADKIYDVFVGEETYKAQPLATREDAHQYFVI